MKELIMFVYLFWFVLDSENMKLDGKEGGEDLAGDGKREIIWSKYTIEKIDKIKSCGDKIKGHLY